MTKKKPRYIVIDLKTGKITSLAKRPKGVKWYKGSADLYYPYY